MKKNSDLSAVFLNEQHIKKILIALDNTPSARKVAESGYFFSRALGAEVILIHVIAEAGTYYSIPEYSPVINSISYQHSSTKKLISNSFQKKSAQYFLDKSKLMFGDDNIQTVVAEGDYADEILGAAENLNVDLIVMGSHHNGWLDKIIFGSVAEQVLNHTSIPLFIVPTSK